MLSTFRLPVRSSTWAVHCSMKSSFTHNGVSLTDASSYRVSSIFHLIRQYVASSSFDVRSSWSFSMSVVSISIVSKWWVMFSGWNLDLALGVLLTSCPSGGAICDGVEGLDMFWGVMSSPSSSSMALLLCRFRLFEVSSGWDVMSGLYCVPVRLTSFSLKGSEVSDMALLLGLGLLPLPDFWRLRLALLTRDWWSCSGMLDVYFSLVLFLSVCPSSVSVPFRALVRPPLWEFLGSAMLTL